MSEANSKTEHQSSGRASEIMPLVAAFGLGSLLFGSMFYGFKQQSEASERYSHIRRQAVAAAAEDGLKVGDKPGHFDFHTTGPNGDRRHMVLDLGGCTLAVSAELVMEGDRTVTDVRNYHFNGYAQATNESHTHNGFLGQRRTHYYIAGEPLAFEFENRQQLEQPDNLGPEPCQTIAQNSILPATVATR